MAINYPTSLDAWTNPTAADTLATTPHSEHHGRHYDAIEALEAKVGITGSAVAGSVDYEIGQLGGYPARSMGLRAHNFDPASTSGTVAWGASGTLHLARLHIGPGTVTNLHVMSATAGTVTASYAALFTLAGALLSQSTSGGVIATNTLKTYALAVAQPVTTAADYYVGFWTTHSVAPSLLGIQGSALGQVNHLNLGTAAPTLRWATADAGLTTTAPSNFTTQTASARAFWVGVS